MIRDILTIFIAGFLSLSMISTTVSPQVHTSKVTKSLQDSLEKKIIEEKKSLNEEKVILFDTILDTKNNISNPRIQNNRSNSTIYKIKTVPVYVKPPVYIYICTSFVPQGINFNDTINTYK